MWRGSSNHEGLAAMIELDAIDRKILRALAEDATLGPGH